MSKGTLIWQIAMTLVAAVSAYVNLGLKAVLLILVVRSVVLIFNSGPVVKIFNAGVAARIHRAPGWSLRGLASFLFSKKVYARVFEPTLADLEKEYIEALAAGKSGQAIWIRARGYGSFWSAFAAQVPVSWIRLWVAIWKASKIG